MKREKIEVEYLLVAVAKEFLEMSVAHEIIIVSVLGRSYLGALWARELRRGSGSKDSLSSGMGAFRECF